MEQIHRNSLFADISRSSGGKERTGGIYGRPVAIPTVVITCSSGFPAAVGNAAGLGVLAMAVSFVIVPIVSSFTKKFDSEFIDTVFK